MTPLGLARSRRSLTPCSVLQCITSFAFGVTRVSWGGWLLLFTPLVIGVSNSKQVLSTKSTPKPPIAFEIVPRRARTAFPGRARESQSATRTRPRFALDPDRSGERGTSGEPAAGQTGSPSVLDSHTIPTT